MSDAILIAVLNVTRIVGFVIRPIIALLDVIRHLLLRIKKWQRKKLTLRALSAALFFSIFFHTSAAGEGPPRPVEQSADTTVYFCRFMVWLSNESAFRALFATLLFSTLFCTFATNDFVRPPAIVSQV
jgi:hypothetical protein